MTMTSASINIPQHPLRNKAGEAVAFDWLTWGTVHNYDFLKAHRHQFHEIFFFESGVARHDIDFQTYDALPGAIHFVASDNVHLVLREPGSTGFSLMFTTDYFSDELIAQLPFSKSSPVLQLETEDFQTVNALAQSIRREHESGAPLSDKIVKSLMEALMLQLVRIYQQKTHLPPASGLPEHLQTFRQLVREQYREHVSVEAYADTMGITAKHLIDLCKKHLGKTPLKFIQEYTVCEAKRLLFHTNSSIKEIAYALNFDDPANFSKYFKANTGYTPATYRKDTMGK